MQARVFRGVGFARGAARLTALVSAYAGAFAVLWGLGLVVRGWQGWALLLAPLAGMVGLRLWAWRRVSVEVAEGVLRYEGASPSADFEIPLERIACTYFDRTLRERPLVLAINGSSLRDGRPAPAPFAAVGMPSRSGATHVIEGDERICGELSPRAARELHDHIVSLGVRALDEAAAARS